MASEGPVPRLVFAQDEEDLGQLGRGYEAIVQKVIFSKKAAMLSIR